MKNAAKIKILPPLIPLTTLLIAGAIHYVTPIKIFNFEALAFTGYFLIIASIMIVLIAAKQFANAKTTLDVRKSSSSLVTTGVFKYTRNPIYLSMVLFCLGVAFIVNSIFLLLAALFAGIGLYLFVIRAEEVYLHDEFGEHYSLYQQSVGRWI